MFSKLSIFSLLAIFPILIRGHAMVTDPLNRASRWRSDSSALINYNDNQLFCGGFAVQYEQNGGKCGLCGDNYADSTPRNHELGGIYGQGVIVKNYTRGSLIPVTVLVTANHKGFFRFNICNLDKFGGESEQCFDDIALKFNTGQNTHQISTVVGDHYVTLQLPYDLICEHCVLQWTYKTGNSWGVCEDGTGAMGCGAQEHFRTCSDISITP